MDNILYKVKDVVSVIEEFAPLGIQESWDNSGLCIGSPESAVSSVLLGLDCTPELVDEAVSAGADMIVTHHPLIFSGLKKISPDDPVGLAVMKAKLQASRAILYETTRFVDIYKAYNAIAEERKLTPEERAESKKYAKYADMFTPVLKMMSSEYCNQNAYDAIQVHGGSGFMKEYPVERIYRDARITTIYEGTSQLQTVAAIRYVTNGSYLAKMREYEQMETSAEYAPLKAKIVAMTDQYEKACALAAERGNEFIDFHARRLVEMAAHILMSYLLVIDAQRCSSFANSANVYTNRAAAWNNERYSYIENFDDSQLAAHYAVREEELPEAE